MTDSLKGLSEQEASERRARGLGNAVRMQAGHTYWQIVRRNALTFINSVLFLISAVLVAMGQFGDALVTAGLVLLNVVVGVFQEGRAKQKLDQIALLARPTATVIRDGQEKSVDPAEIVLGDLLVARPGDQFVVDGSLAGDGRVEVDESLLTGESDHVAKGPGDPVYSGTFCVTGTARYEAQKVGADSVVSRLTAGARAFRQHKTPLQRDIERIIRLLTAVVGVLGLMLAFSWLLGRISPVEALRIAAVIVALVPQGLFFMTTVAYAMGAVRVAASGALVQETNAVEWVGGVDLLCLDKTGTLTSNRLQLDSLWPVPGAQEGGEARLRQAVGDYAASTSGANKTTAALAEALGGRARPVREEVAFSSERKWSALTFDDGTYVLGAPDVLRPALRPEPDLSATADGWTDSGLRVLLFAHRPDGAKLRDGAGQPHLPDELEPLGLLGFCDELRHQARETLDHFTELGVGYKLISGDHPRTVVGLLRQLGVGHELKAVSGLDLQAAGPEDRVRLAREATVLGRVTPQQKEELVELLQGAGHTVAMIGDGVNDVLSLKQANVGIAMRSGSQAARSVADILLLDDSFAVLPVAFREGQRIVRGMEDVVRLLLTRTLCVLLLVVGTWLAGLPFPLTPKHNSVIALLTVGLPILAIAAWARPGPTSRSIIRSTLRFVLPAAVTIGVVMFGVYAWQMGRGADLDQARSALTTAGVLCGLLLIPFVEPPSEMWVGGDVLSGDRRPALLALAMLAVYAGILAVPPLRGFFELKVLAAWEYGAIAAIAAAWAVLVRGIWRARFAESAQ